MSTITLIGLGPGDPLLLTRAAWAALSQADTIYTPTPEHPALAEFAEKVSPLNASDQSAFDWLVQQARGGTPVSIAWRGVHAHDQAVVALRAAALSHHIPLTLLPDVRHELHPLPVADNAAPRSWAETQPESHPYTPPLVPTDPLADQRSSDALRYVTQRLLAPGGCPWDVQQTHQSLRANLLEETYEVLEALDAGDMETLADELGDLLMQVFVHSEMARQAAHFDLEDVVEHITSKLIRRHPHVFTELRVEGTEDVLHNWEQIKAQELAAKGKERHSALDGIPADLPALAAAQKYASKAARAGFDWPDLHHIRAKLHEELGELEQAYQQHQQTGSAESRAHLEDEFGDALYALAQVGRWLHLDAESALRLANAKFERRFRRVEQAAAAQHLNLRDLSLEELLALWREAKGKG